MKFKLTLTASLFCLFPLVGKAAPFALRASSDFAHQYDGNEMFDGMMFNNGWALSDNPTDVGDINDYSLSGTSLVVNQTTVDESWVEQDNGASPFELALGGSYTVELSARVLTNEITLWLDDHVGRSIMIISHNATAEGIGPLVLAVNQTLDTSDNSDAQHLFRIAYDDDAGRYHYYRDGVQLTPDEGIPSGPKLGSPERLLFGDCCSTIGGPGTDYEIGYIRYDMTGAYAPMPISEPSGLALLCLGGVGVLGRALFLRS